MAGIFTIGYQGCEVDDFVDDLRSHGVTLLVDVRDHTASRKPGFSKTRLGRHLLEVGVGYEHWKDLGTPKRVRDLLRVDKDWEAYRTAYLRKLDDRPDLLAALAERTSVEQACLMCYERDASGCHRYLIVQRMRERGYLDEVVHLLPAIRRSVRGGSD